MRVEREHSAIRGFRQPVQIALACSVAVSSLVTHAEARTTVTPRIEVRQVFSDNSGVSTSGDTGVFTVISPGLSIQSQSARISGGLDVAYERRIPLSGRLQQDKDRVNLVARADAVVVRDLLYLNAGGTITRVLNDLRLQSTLNPDTGANNLNNVKSFFIGPRLERLIPDVGVFSTGYTFSYTDVERNNPDRALFASGPLGVGLSNGGITKSHAAFARLQREDFSGRLRWSIGGSFDRSETDFTNNVYQSIRGTLEGELALLRQFSLVGSLGYEDFFSEDDNYFLPNGDLNVNASGLPTPFGRRRSVDQNGLTWDVGFRWSPSTRSDVTVRGGERFGEITYNAVGNLRPARGHQISFSYTQGVDTFGRIFTQRLAGVTTTSVSRDQSSGFPGLFFLGSPLFATTLGDFQSVNSATFRLRAGQLTYSIDRGPRKFALSFGYDRRNFLDYTPLGIQFTNPALRPRLQDLQQADEGYAGSLSFSQRLNPRMGITSNLFYRRNQFALSEGREDNFYGLNLGYDWRLGPLVTFGANYYLSRRDSNQSGQDSTENALSLSLRASF
jgi:hypothetical protein